MFLTVGQFKVSASLSVHRYKFISLYLILWWYCPKYTFSKVKIAFMCIVHELLVFVASNSMTVMENVKTFIIKYICNQYTVYYSYTDKCVNLLSMVCNKLFIWLTICSFLLHIIHNHRVI